MSTFALWILLVSLVHATFWATLIRNVARQYIYTASICNLLDVRGSRTLVLILRNQRKKVENYHMLLVKVFSESVS